MQQDQYALVGGNIIAANGDAPITDGVILVNQGRIQAVDHRQKLTLPDGIEQIDISGKWVTPGLIDTNVHLILMTVPEFFVKYEDQWEEIALQAAQVGLKYGLTTMADTWGPLPPLLQVRDKINRGEAVGSRMLIGGNIVGTGGPFTAFFMGGWDLGGASLRYGGWVHPKIQDRINRLWEDEVGPDMAALTPNEAGERLAKYLTKGVDFVKVGVSAHGISPVEPLVFSAPALRAMRDATLDAGVPFQTHTFTVESLRMALEVNTTLLQHPNVMSVSWQSASSAQKQAIKNMIDQIAEEKTHVGLMMVPDKQQLARYKQWQLEGEQDPHLENVLLERWPMMTEENYQNQKQALQPWLREDLLITLATDAGLESADIGPVVWGRLGRAHFDRLRNLQEVGLSPMQVIMSATRNGAQALGIGHDTGTIEVGKFADLLVINSNPLDDVSNLKQIHAVIKEGQIVDRDALPINAILDSDPEAVWPH